MAILVTPPEGERLEDDGVMAVSTFWSAAGVPSGSQKAKVDEDVEGLPIILDDPDVMAVLVVDPG